MDVGDIFWMLVPAHVKRSCILVTKIAKTVTNILELSPTHFVANIRHQHRCHSSMSFNRIQILIFTFTQYLENSIANEQPLYLNFQRSFWVLKWDGCEMQIWNLLKCSFCSRSSSWGFLFWTSLSSPSKRFLTKAKSSIFVGIWIDERIRLRSFAHWSWISILQERLI